MRTHQGTALSKMENIYMNNKTKITNLIKNVSDYLNQDISNQQTAHAKLISSLVELESAEIPDNIKMGEMYVELCKYARSIGFQEMDEKFKLTDLAAKYLDSKK